MVFVFKTSVEDENHIQALGPVLDALVQPDGRWNFDLDDCDRILRIEGGNFNISDLVTHFGNLGFVCTELPD